MSHFRKAILAGLGAAAAFLAPVVDDGLTSGELLGALAALLVSGGTVYAVPNATDTPAADTA